jgi:hypothetical protein
MREKSPKVPREQTLFSVAFTLFFVGLAIFLLLSAIAFRGRATQNSTGYNPSGPDIRSLTAPSISEAWTLYDSDANHIWNRLYRCLYRRIGPKEQEYGYNELDPLLWPSTKYLLKSPANEEANAVLDEFISTHAERKISDPLKRAILQRDLWAVFDWTTQTYPEFPTRLPLQKKLAQVLKRLALSRDQIADLPNTYSDAVNSGAFAVQYDSDNRDRVFLPARLFDPVGPWVKLSVRGGNLIGQTHVQSFSGRSVFQIFMSLPEGRAATLKYLQALSEFPEPWIPRPIRDDVRRLVPNPKLPQFPTGTQLALVREMMVIDSEGTLRPTSIVEDVQIRVHRTIPSEVPEGLNTSRNEAQTALDVYEFKMRRPILFAHQTGGLIPVKAQETEFPLFMSHGIDLFEEVGNFPLERALRTSLSACSSCHFRPGIHSMISREHGELLPAWDANYEATGTSLWKQHQYNWGLFRGLWESQSSRRPS